MGYVVFVALTAGIIHKIRVRRSRNETKMGLFHSCRLIVTFMTICTSKIMFVVKGNQVAFSTPLSRRFIFCLLFVFTAKHRGKKEENN